MLGGTEVVPDFTQEKTNYQQLETKLSKDFGMNQRQLVSHWKYVADLFPKSFPTARLNFDIDPPTRNRAGQDTLDEISDYLVFRYGQRIYLARQNVCSARHGFDEFRVLLKFRSDTLLGYRLSDDFMESDWGKLAKNALDDGISFVEIPKAFIQTPSKEVQDSLNKLAGHLGCQIVLRAIEFNRTLKSGDPLKVSLSFSNEGSATPKTSSRQLDKDVPVSFQIGFEIRDKSGKSLLLSVQTPKPPTTQWTSGKIIAWQDDYRLAALADGEYSISLTVIDKQTKRRLNILDGTQPNNCLPASTVDLGKIKISAD
jgi:hypothetical protein